MGMVLMALVLLALLGIGTAAWIGWGAPAEAELRRGGTLIGLSVAMLMLTVALVIGLQPLG
jgi:hypothetical protein